MNRQGRMKRGHVLLKSQGKKGRPNLNLCLTVPQHLVDKYDLEAGLEFVCEVTDEGLLYRPVVKPRRPGEPRPAWLA